MKGTMVGALGALALAGAVLAQAPSARRAPVNAASLRPSIAPAMDTDDDARRAAAGRLLVASHFRERQAVVLPDGIKAAQGDLTTDCVDRAATGRSLADCRATADPSGTVATRLQARKSDMLDELMTASQTVYARRFTAAEMDEITRFFRTPVGRKYGDLYPQVIAEVQARRNAIVKRYLIAADRSASR